MWVADVDVHDSRAGLGSIDRRRSNLIWRHWNGAVAGGVSADPVTAQLTMILRGIQSARNLLLPMGSSLDAQVRVVNYLSPLCDFALDAGAKLFRFIRHGFEPEFKQAFSNSWIRHRFGDLAL